jgi:hypothetical protein
LNGAQRRYLFWQNGSSKFLWEAGPAMNQTSESLGNVRNFVGSGFLAAEVDDDMRRRIQEREEKARDQAEKAQREADERQRQAELERNREKLNQP